MADVNKETQPIDVEKIQESGGAVSGDVLHGGEEDPLGGGVADLKDEQDITEGVPQQDS